MYFLIVFEKSLLLAKAAFDQSYYKKTLIFWNILK